MGKNLITSLALLLAIVSFGQAKTINGNAKINDGAVSIEDVSIHVTVDSAEEIKSTFTIGAIKELLDESAESKEISFKITCNGSKMASGVKSHVSYEVKGNTDDKKNFLRSIKKIRKAAIKYYQSKQ